MKSVKSRLVLALSLVELLTLGMAIMLYAGSNNFDDNARRTRQANDDLRELLDFSLVSHGYMDAFGRSLGQRTLIANRDRREAATAFQKRIAKIPEMHQTNGGLSSLDWKELQDISSLLSAGLLDADGFRAQGDFVQAERRFAEVRQSVFGSRMLPWFEQAIGVLRSDARAREAEALDSSTKLRATGIVLALLSSAVASLAVLWISGSIVRPVRALVGGAEAIQRGDLEHRVRLAGNDEFALVSDSFNRMAATVAASQASLLAQNEKLERAYRMQGEFISMVTHELRSPLHSIQGYLEFVEDDEPNLAEASRRHLFNIGESAKRLLRLVNDILDFSKLEARQLDVVRQRIELGPLLEDSVADARALVRERPIELVFDALPEPVSLYSDETRLRQILTNLLSNAVKFTERGRVTLAVALAPERVELTVSDTGVGIPGAQLGAIFEPFRQAASAGSFAHGGTGLGLAIVARLAELIDARISVKSELGQGSDFTVSLPRAGGEARQSWPIS
jgi:signal transduction histidine kinase